MHIEITEGSGSALTGYQVPITLDTKTFDYNKADASGADIRFTESDIVTAVDYWIEAWNTSGTSTIWVEVDLGANATETFYMYYGNANASSESNESNVFDYVDRGNQGTSWAAVGTAGQDNTNGNPAPSYNVSSTSGSYMYRDIGLVPGRVITFNVWTNGLGNIYYLANASGAGQHYRADTRAAPDYSGWNTSVNWTSSLAPSSGFQTTASTWYKFTIVATNATSATYYYEQTTSSSPQISGTLEGTHTITNVGSYIGLVGDVLGAAYSTRWDNIVVRKYVGPEPTVNLGEEEATFSWTDYFGGTAGISIYSMVNVSDGDVVVAMDYNDEFDDASLDAKWSWLNEPGLTPVAAGGWDEGNTTAGRIHMISDQNTDFREPFENGHILYQNISGDFEVEIKLYGVPSQNVEQSGLGVAQDVDNFFKFGYGDVWVLFHFRSMAVYTEVNAVYSEAAAPIVDAGTPKYLRLRRTGDQWQSWYREDAGTTQWTHVATWTQELADPVMLGLAVADGADGPGSNYHTEFDYFRLKRYVTSTEVPLRHQPGWDKFYASHTIPANTSIDYSILDASDGSTLCTINAAQAAAGYDLFTCAGSVDPIKLHAELSTTNVSITPAIHSWNVTRSSPPLYLIPGSEIYSNHGGQVGCPADQHHLCVDEFPNHDGAATRVEGFLQTGWLTDLYGPKDFGNPYFGTIDSVELHYWVTGTGVADALSRGFVRVGSDDYISPIYYGGNSNNYQEKVFNVTANRSWNWYDLNNIQFGFLSRYPGFLQVTRTTQCYLEIDYTPLSYW